MKKISSIVFVLTAECTHKCKYCFDQAHYPLFTINYTAKDVQRFLDQNRSWFTSPLNIVIHGGDVLLAPNFGEIAETILNYPHDIHLQFFFSSLPVKAFSKYSFLMNSNLGISMDGPEHIHNLNRKRTDGKNSFKEIEYLLYTHGLKTFFLSVISSNTIQYIQEVEAFFLQFRVPHYYILDRRAKYWSRESLDLLRHLPVYAWGCGTAAMFNQKTLDEYWTKYIVFANGDINLFGHEFMPSHELRKIGNIKDGVVIEDSYQSSIEGLKICEHSCRECDKRCKKYSAINDVTADNPHSIPPPPKRWVFQDWSFFDPSIMKKSSLKDKKMNLIPFHYPGTGSLLINEEGRRKMNERHCPNY